MHIKTTIKIIHHAIADVMNYLTSFRFDDSDGQIDYYCTNFYMNVSIGRGRDKPCVVKEPKNFKINDKSKKEVKVA